MRSSRARSQLLTLLLLGAFALLSLDGGPVRDAVAGYLAGLPGTEAPAPSVPEHAVQGDAMLACPQSREDLRVFIHRLVAPEHPAVTMPVQAGARRFLEGAAS